MADLTDEQCDAFRRLPGSFNDMVRAIYRAGMNAATPPADAALADDALCESLIEASDMRWNGDVYIGDGADLMNLVRAALRARAVPDERVVWQFRDRGGEQWQDAQDEFHAETLRRRSFLLRGVVVVTKVSGDYPPAAMLAASKGGQRERPNS